MTGIPIVGGEIDAAQLGRTLMHEHVFIRTPDLQESWPGFMGWNEETAVADAHRKLSAIKASGIDTIVDMTVPGLGRQVRRVARAVAGTGLQVIAVTGFYTYANLPFPFRFHGKGKLLDNDPDDRFLVDLFVRDVVEGIEGTDIRAGAVKCVTDEPGVTEDVDRVIRAAAKTHLRTDVPIITHSHAKSRRGLDQQRILREEGVDLSRVVIGHSNEADDIGYLIEVLDNGSYLGFDRCGISVDEPLDAQQAMLVELCRRGYADRIVLAHDRHCTSDWFTDEAVATVVPEWHHGFIQGSLVPGLLDNGVTQDQIDQMLIHNPRRFFAARKNAVAPVDGDQATASG